MISFKLFVACCNQQRTNDRNTNERGSAAASFFLPKLDGRSNDHDQDHWLLTNVKRSLESLPVLPVRSFVRISRGHGERKELSKSCIATTSRTGSHRILSIATMLCILFPPFSLSLSLSLSRSFFIFWTAQFSLIYTFFYTLDLKRSVPNLSVAQNVLLLFFFFLFVTIILMAGGNVFCLTAKMRILKYKIPCISWFLLFKRVRSFFESSWLEFFNE